MCFSLIILFLTSCITAVNSVQLSNGSIYVGPDQGQRFQPYPMLGTSRTFKLRGSDTNNAFVLMEGLLLINETSKLHYHEREEETFRILSGALQLLIGNETFCALPGTVVFAPRNTWMAFRNSHSTNTIVEFLFTPAGIDNYFDKVNRILTDNSTNKTSQLSAIAIEYGLIMRELPPWQDIGCGKNMSTSNAARISYQTSFLFAIIIILSIVFLLL